MRGWIVGLALVCGCGLTLDFEPDPDSGASDATARDSAVRDGSGDGSADANASDGAVEGGDGAIPSDGSVHDAVVVDAETPDAMTDAVAVDSADAIPACVPGDCALDEYCNEESGVCEPRPCDLNGEIESGELCDDGDDTNARDGCHECVPGCLDDSHCADEPDACREFLCVGVDDGTGAASCVQSLRDDADADADGFYPPRCGVSPSDCDDSNPEVHPDQREFFETATESGSFDYNCDEIIEKDSNYRLLECRGLSMADCRGRTGWVEFIPECGDTGALGTCEFTAGIGCRRSLVLDDVTVSCR